MHSQKTIVFVVRELSPRFRNVYLTSCLNNSNNIEIFSPKGVWKKAKEKCEKILVIQYFMKGQNLIILTIII